MCELEHFFTTRESSVDDNKVLICQYLNVAPKCLIHPEQTHSSNVAIVEPARSEYQDTDSVILTNKIQSVYLRFADCVPIIFYDYKYNIAAIAHAGWRGTASKIVVKTLIKMVKLNNSSPENI